MSLRLSVTLNTGTVDDVICDRPRKVGNAEMVDFGHVYAKRLISGSPSSR